jgi:hypothetical protein
MDKVIVVDDSDSENESPECYGVTAKEHSQLDSRQQSSSQATVPDDSKMEQTEAAGGYKSNNIDEFDVLAADTEELNSENNSTRERDTVQSHNLSASTCIAGETVQNEILPNETQSRDKVNGSEYDKSLDARDVPSDNTKLGDTQEGADLQLDDYVDRMVQERIAELQSASKESSESETITENAVQLEVESNTNAIEDGKLTAQEQVINKKAARNDPYAGYLAPSGRNKRQRTKKNRLTIEEIEYDSMDIAPPSVPLQYNGVTVSYTEESMPPDMNKYVASIIMLCILEY